MNVEAREALPDYLNGRLGALDQATMKAHVESCADCRAELAVLREIRDRSLLAPKLDIDRIASAIRPYAGSRVVPAARRPSYAWRLAAAVGVIAVAGLVLTSRDGERVQSNIGTPSFPAVAVTAVPEPGAPAAVSSAPEEVQVAALSLVGGTSGLSEDDLEQLVQDLEGIEAMPDAEPSSITVSVDDAENDNDQ